jgi:hypothetical protein
MLSRRTNIKPWLNVCWSKQLTHILYKMDKVAKNIVFHTKCAIHHKKIANALQNSPTLITEFNKTYIPFHVNYIDKDDLTVVGKMYTPIWNDVWRKITRKYILNYSYLPLNCEQSYIVQNGEKYRWSIFETTGAMQSQIQMPISAVKEGDIILFCHKVNYHNAILM